GRGDSVINLGNAPAPISRRWRDVGNFGTTRTGPAARGSCIAKESQLYRAGGAFARSWHRRQCGLVQSDRLGVAPSIAVLRAGSVGRDLEVAVSNRRNERQPFGFPRLEGGPFLLVGGCLRPADREPLAR